MVDVVGALTDQLTTICSQLKMQSSDGKYYKTDAANTKGILRIIQSVPSPKAEPFKLWLAQVGSDKLDEIENPELAQKRIRETYRAKGYSDEWIEQRIRGMAENKAATQKKHVPFLVHAFCYSFIKISK